MGKNADMANLRAIGTILLLCSPVTVAGQSVFSVDVGATNVTYTDRGQSTAASLSPFFSAWSPRGSLTGTANFSRFNASGWSLQGMANASALSSATAPVRFEALGMLSGTSFSGGNSSNFASARARLHVVGQSGGAWVGGGAGRSDDGAVVHDLILGDVAGWIQSGPTLFQLVVTPTRLQNEVTYTDAEATISRFGNRADLYASAGSRVLSGGNASWASAGITYRIVSWLGIAASAGNYAPDYTQGIPGGRFISAALRFSPGSSASTYNSAGADIGAKPLIQPELSEDAPPASEKFSAFSAGRVTGSGDMREIRIRAPGASAVEIAGDFTYWEPVQMRNAGNGWWVASLKLPAGIYHMNVRADNGSWSVPAGMTVIQDEFAGSVGILVIE